VSYSSINEKTIHKIIINNNWPGNGLIPFLQLWDCFFKF